MKPHLSPLRLLTALLLACTLFACNGGSDNPQPASTSQNSGGGNNGGGGGGGTTPVNYTYTAPSVVIVDSTDTSITFKIVKNDSKTTVAFYKVNDGNATIVMSNGYNQNITVSGLTSNTTHTVCTYHPSRTTTDTVFTQSPSTCKTVKTKTSGSTDPIVDECQQKYKNDLGLDFQQGFTLQGDNNVELRFLNNTVTFVSNGNMTKSFSFIIDSQNRCWILTQGSQQGDHNISNSVFATFIEPLPPFNGIKQVKIQNDIFDVMP